MKIKLILAILLCGVISITGCKAVKSAFGWGESTEQVQEPTPQETNGKVAPFEPTEEDVERGKSLFTVLLIAVSVLGVVFVSRLLYIRRRNKK